MKSHLCTFHSKLHELVLCFVSWLTAYLAMCRTHCLHQQRANTSIVKHNVATKWIAAHSRGNIVIFFSVYDYLNNIFLAIYISCILYLLQLFSYSNDVERCFKMGWGAPIVIACLHYCVLLNLKNIPAPPALLCIAEFKKYTSPPPKHHCIGF